MRFPTQLKVGDLLVGDIRDCELTTITVAGFDESIAGQRWLLSLPGATSTTLRSVGFIVALVAVIVLGKTAYFPPTALAGDMVQHSDHISQAVDHQSSVLFHNQDNLSLASSVELSDSDEEPDAALDRIFHALVPSRGRATGSRPNLDHDINHDVHLTGSQFDLDGLANVRMLSLASTPAASIGDSAGADAGLGEAHIDEIRSTVHSYHETGFDFTCKGPADDDSVSVASMAVIIDQDEIQALFYS